MQNETALASVGHAIQLSVAPVFLLTAIGALLGVLTHRLARVIDLARVFEARAAATRPEELSALHEMLATRSRRATMINRSITLFTITALLVCGVIATLFLGAFFQFPVAAAVAALFVAAMVAMIAGLLFFLREIFVATAALRIGIGHGQAPGSGPARHPPGTH